MDNIEFYTKVWDRGAKSWEVSFLSVYPITMFLGILFSFLSAAYFWRRNNYSWETIQVLLIITIPTSIIGARFWFLVSNGGWSTWYIFQGLSIHGGVVLSALSGIAYVYARRSIIDMRTAVGIILPCVLIGQVIGRWGNFANHEVFGKPVHGDSLNWLTFIKPHMLIRSSGTLVPDALRISGLGSDVAYRAPLFFYEMMANLFGYIVIVWFFLRKNWFKPGVTGGFYFLWYGIVRLIMEPMRDEADIMKIGSIPTSVAVSVIYIIVGLWLFIWWQILTKPNGKVTSKYIKGIINAFDKEYKKNVYIKNPKDIFGLEARLKKINEKLKVVEQGSLKQKWLKYCHYVVDSFFNRKIILWEPILLKRKWSKREINMGKLKKD